VIKKIGDDWNEKLACQVVTQILEALKALHEKKIVHRNVTIFNILVKSWDKNKIQVELAGFSQATSAKKPVTEDCISLDTYKSPEMAANLPYDTLTDMWMIACCAFTMYGALHAEQQTCAIWRIYCLVANLVWQQLEREPSFRTREESPQAPYEY